MGAITDALNKYNCNINSLDELYDIFKSVGDYDIPIVRFTLYKGAGLIRQRINPKREEFHYVTELSYPPSVCLTKLGRANLPYQSMFYACSFPNEENYNTPLPRIISLLETSQFFKNKNNFGIERSTVSRWELAENINLIALPFSNTYQRPCQDVLDVITNWEDIISNANNDGLELILYMAKEIAKDFDTDDGYVKIANFVNYLLHINSKTKDADGIIYPSVPARGGGFNVAIKPEIVDKKIKFCGASLCYLLKQRDKSYVHIIKDSLVNEDGSLTFYIRKQNKDATAMYDKYARGLSFVN